MRFILIFTFLLISFHFVQCQELTGIISRVTDGDSFDFLNAEGVKKIRLYGIDCPEINQPFGDSAKIFLSHYLNDTVTIIIRDRDKYGRTIADVFIRDTSINYQLLERGLAWHYKKYSQDSVYAAAEAEAQYLKTGLWRKEVKIAPWDWRAGKYDRSLLSEDNSIKFFICIGKENTTYHTVHYCEELKNCNSSIILVQPAEAVEVYHKTACSKCIQSNP